MTSFKDAIERILPDLVTLRHELHQHPELGYEERRTHARLMAELEQIPGLSLRTGLAETGIVATLNGDKAGACVALRSDMDALPLTEENDCPWVSQHEGRMHACGHDGHMTALIGAARVLAEHATDLPGKVKFVFQPAEEGGAGGQRMVDEGALDDPTADAAFAFHGWPDAPFGSIIVGAGPIFAATSAFNLELTGTGTHAAFPHLGHDLVLTAAQCINALQAIAARRTAPYEPVVVSVTCIHAGEAFNILPDRCHLKGTIRAMTTEQAERIKQEMERILAGVCGAAGVSHRIEYYGDYPALVNDADLAEMLVGVAGGMQGEDAVDPSPPPTLGGEDFSYFAQRVPSAMWRLGLKPEGATDFPQLHHPRFDFPDAALPLAVEMHCRVAQQFLSEQAG
jgi:amidohydrolase